MDFGHNIYHTCLLSKACSKTQSFLHRVNCLIALLSSKIQLSGVTMGQNWWERRPFLCLSDKIFHFFLLSCKPHLLIPVSYWPCKNQSGERWQRWQGLFSFFLIFIFYFFILEQNHLKKKKAKKKKQILFHGILNCVYE